MKKFLKNLKLSWKYTKDKKVFLILLILMNILSIVVSIILPLYYSKIIIKLANSEFRSILFIAIIILIIEVVKSVLHYLNRFFAQCIYRDSFSKIQLNLAKETLKLNVNVFEDNGSGVFIQRLSNDASNLADIFNSILNYVTDIFAYIGRYVAILVISPIMFVYLILATFLLWIIEKKRANKVNAKDKEVRKRKEKASGFISELVRGVKDIKMLNAEKSFIKVFDSRVKDSNYGSYQMQALDRNFRLYSDVLYALLDFIMIIFLLFMMIENYIGVEGAIIIWNYSGGLLYVTSFFGRIMDCFKNFNLSSERVFNIINGNEFPKEKFGNKKLEYINGDFEFKNVNFSYGKNKVLDGINFKVNANETVAFVGKSGAGKTTIFNLLCKMYEPNKGTITIDGVNIKKLDKDSIRGNITIISQNPYIFNMSIRDNLRLVKEDLTEEDMISSCKMACLHDFIMKQPEGYDTMIGEGGLNLSGGQRQRLAIARAFVQKTEIILFDEATSALDNETQANIQKAITNMKGEYTILIIAHRLSTIVNSDRILFINEGKVEAEGSHKELLKTCINYKHLYESEIKSRK